MTSDMAGKESRATSVKVTVLLQGYSYTDEGGSYHATGSSTLVRGKAVNVIVDTGGPWDKNNIIKALEREELTVDDINFVVCTHGHSDHVGNLNLFCNATQIVGFDINQGDVYQEHSFKSGDHFFLEKGEIEVIPTPGHMHHDVSVYVHNADGLGKVVVAGDLFECEHDENSWRDISEWPEEQEIQRARVKDMADYIIPGHGPMFKVTK